MEVKKVAVDEAARMSGTGKTLFNRNGELIKGTPEDVAMEVSAFFEKRRKAQLDDLLDKAMPAMSPHVAKLREARQRAEGLRHSTILRG